MGRNRLAVLVGCNYPDTINELKGCINDVHSVRDLLIKRFGFKSENIKVLTDAPQSSVKPTGAEIKTALNKMIDDSEAGDVLFFHFSGHGTQMRPGENECEGSEAIVPCDLNLITDVDFRLLVNRIPIETSFTILADSCHSGGLIDKEKEQIGPALNNHRRRMTLPAASRRKEIPYESIRQQLNSMSSRPSSDISIPLTALYGEQASAKFKLAPVVQLDLKTPPDSGILLSGCRPDEHSWDVPGVDGGKAHGAFSNAVHTVLKDNNEFLNNWKVVWLAGRVLQKQEMQQHPCLYCSDTNATAPFLSRPGDHHFGRRDN